MNVTFNQTLKKDIGQKSCVLVRTMVSLFSGFLFRYAYIHIQRCIYLNTLKFSILKDCLIHINEFKLLLWQYVSVGGGIGP